MKKQLILNLSQDLRNLYLENEEKFFSRRNILYLLHAIKMGEEVKIYKVYFNIDHIATIKKKRGYGYKIYLENFDTGEIRKIEEGEPLRVASIISGWAYRSDLKERARVFIRKRKKEDKEFLGLLDDELFTQENEDFFRERIGRIEEIENKASQEEDATG